MIATVLDMPLYIKPILFWYAIYYESEDALSNYDHIIVSEYMGRYRVPTYIPGVQT